MKKLLNLFLAIFFFAYSFPYVIKADDDTPFTDTEYWEERCANETASGSNNVSDKCRKYYISKLSESNETIRDLNKQKDLITKDLEAALEKANAFALEASKYESDISLLTVQIKDLQSQIEELIKEVEDNSAKVEELNQRVLNRMRDSQGTMHFNPYLDFILGSVDFDDLNRRSYGVEAIMQKDKADRTSLIEIINKLKADEEKLEKDKSELDTKKKDLQEKQAIYYAKKELYDEIAAENQRKLDEIRNQLESEKKNYADIADSIDMSKVPPSESLASPVPGAGKSAGTWYYPASFGGGIHLGVDYAVGKGSNIYAPANGVVILSSDGCGDGYLGNSCAGNGGGVAYGGNQVIMMVAANGSIYAISFFHMLKGSPVARGPIEQGDYVGRVGSSGNSTGPHCHVELYYLGPGDMSDLENDYLYRNYSLSFNCGWGAQALNRRCEDGVGAPCRLRPENYFGA